MACWRFCQTGVAGAGVEFIIIAISIQFWSKGFLRLILFRLTQVLRKNCYLGHTGEKLRE
jgi:hypothetical protein